MYWYIERKGRPDLVFHSVAEMEEYLEHLLENRIRSSRTGLGNMDPNIKRRAAVIRERQRARTKAEPMMFHSQWTK